MYRLIFDIQKEIALGVLSFNAIALKHDVPISLVEDVWDQMCIQEFSEE